MAFNLRNLLSRSRYSVVCLVNGPEVKHRQLSNSNSKKHLYLSTANREQLLAWLIWQRPLNWRIYQRAFSLSWYMLTLRLRPAHNQNKQLIKKKQKSKNKRLISPGFTAQLWLRSVPPEEFARIKGSEAGGLRRNKDSGVDPRPVAAPR